MPKLSDTQAVLLASAAARSDLSVLPPPERLTLKGAALERTLSALNLRRRSRTSPGRHSTPIHSHAFVLGGFDRHPVRSPALVSRLT